jgi:hypothetical protein
MLHWQEAQDQRRKEGWAYLMQASKAQPLDHID